MKRVFIGLGSNIGDRHRHLHTAIRHIEVIPRSTLIAVSTFYCTPAWGNVNQEDFLNACVQIHTYLSADVLMRYLLTIEESMGRVRGRDKWQPRTIDLDILDYNQEIFESNLVIVPHPYLHQRLFALLPLQELYPEYVHPRLNLSIQDLIARNQH
ncbi:MAG: 2-amino-4-hydroxy-6-hydroxymethyldihydropteridine diphosphokinase [Bacteroidia bacterium]|nr:2-amino-4-hydroxy-6-hydroxymethyldihydropteridine diphosphokinase [Bacteroidia bacterium]MDW8348119.1 2-amino-4-hydroxy-6-hydroxymethyldihydropteridine diphosphokinase [Bacteroidia bacterium]